MLSQQFRVKTAWSYSLFFCLAHITMHRSLRRSLETGQRRLADWLIEQRAAQVLFDRSDDFVNINTAKDLDDLVGKLDDV